MRFQDLSPTKQSICVLVAMLTAAFSLYFIFDLGRPTGMRSPNVYAGSVYGLRMEFGTAEEVEEYIDKGYTESKKVGAEFVEVSVVFDGKTYEMTFYQLIDALKAYKK